MQRPSPAAVNTQIAIDRIARQRGVFHEVTELFLGETPAPAPRPDPPQADAAVGAEQHAPVAFPPNIQRGQVRPIDDSGGGSLR